MTIQVFKYEEQDGLADLVGSNASIAYTSDVKYIHINTNQLLKLQELLGASAKANPNQFDLYYLESILASLGWNANDDVFDKVEAWNARNTPVDKPFNFMHNEKDIIGHLTSSKVVDFDGNIISDNTPLDKLPDQFDIVVGSVLYKTWSDSELSARMDKIITEISEGKWCVSMECLFRHFDYAVRWTEGDQEFSKIVARNDETSFLTKHLRIYGGSGQYGNYRIGRLLRNFTFSGKGLVDKPANPRSHITSFNESGEVSSFVGALATAEELNLSKEEKVMSDVVYTKEQYEALKTELDQIKAASQQAAQKEVDELRAQIDELTNKNQALSTELEASKEVSKAKEDKVVALEAELSDAQAKLVEAEKKIKDAEVAAVNASRKALLLERVDEEKAENLVQKFANASQEMFDALVDSLPKKAESAKTEDKEDDKEEDDDESCGSEEVKTDIDEAQADDSAEMASGGSHEEETLRSKASAWFSQNVLRSTANKKDK